MSSFNTVKGNKEGDAPPLFIVLLFYMEVLMVNSVSQRIATDGKTNIQQSSSVKKATSPVSKINEELTQTTDALIQEREQTQKVVEQIQKITSAMGRRLQFNVNEALGQIVVKVIDPSTDKVIKEIPSAEVQKMQIRIKEAIGLIFDETV